MEPDKCIIFVIHSEDRLAQGRGKRETRGRGGRAQVMKIGIQKCE